jgi:hypothetical protein
VLEFKVEGAGLTADGGGFDGLTRASSPFQGLTAADVVEKLEFIDLRPLADEVRFIAKDDAQQRARAGLDVDGVPLTPLRRGDGVPIAGVGDAMVVEVLHESGGDFLIRGTWPTMPFLSYHVEGAGHDPVRRVVGLSDEARERLREATRDFALGLLGRS